MLKLSQARLFTFNASSFSLEPSVESFLKFRGTITLDFGTLAYINSEMMPAILLELIEKAKNNAASNSDLVTRLKAEVGRYSAERQKIVEESSRLASQVKSYSAEVTALKEQAAATTKLIETLKAENARLQLMANNATSMSSGMPPASVDIMRHSYERLQKDLQTLRSQNAEALTSLKVLEDENDELMGELDKLRNQQKNAPTANTG